MNVYDFDGTIYNGDSTIDFFLYVLKKKPYIIISFPMQALGFVLYGMRLIDKTKLKEYFFSFLLLINAEKMVELFWDEHQSKIYSWYLDQQKDTDIIISASPEFLLNPICNRLKIEYLIASKVNTSNGKFNGLNCKGKEKVNQLKEVYNITHIDNFYSDSLSDSPLALIANKAYIVKNGKLLEWRITNES